MSPSPHSPFPCCVRPAVASLALLLSGVLPPAQLQAEPAPEQAPKDARALLAAYASMPGLGAEFVERKYMALLAKPLESRGHIYFERPAKLLRKVEQPLPSSILVTQTAVHIKDSEGSRTIDLRSQKEVQPFVQSLLWLLAGDLVALQRAYAVDYAVQPDGAWKLSLVPKRKPLSQLIARMEMRGQGLSVHAVEVHESSGDRSVTEILAANPARRFSAQERVRLFQPAASAKR